MGSSGSGRISKKSWCELFSTDLVPTKKIMYFLYIIFFPKMWVFWEKMFGEKNIRHLSANTVENGKFLKLFIWITLVLKVY